MWADAYYINLDARTDRRAHIETELLRVGITAERFSAIGPSKWEGKRPSPTIHRKRRPGNSGCYKSHASLMSRIAISQRNTLILEDDCLFCDDFSTRLSYIASHLPPVWDIFFLNATFHYPTPYWHKTGDATPTVTPHIWRTFGLFGTQSYIVNARSASKILSMMRANLHHAYAIDHLFIRLQPRLQCFCFCPGLTTQYDNYSDITNKHAPFSGHHRLGPHVFQKEPLCDLETTSPLSSPNASSTASLPK